MGQPMVVSELARHNGNGHHDMPNESWTRYEAGFEAGYREGFAAGLGQARLQRLKGNHHVAVEELRRAELSQVDLGSFDRAIFDLELGCCWLEGNKLELSIDVLRESSALFGRGGNQMEQAVAQLWLEVASSAQNPDEATSRLRELLPARRD